jgi:hypothetical protein
MWCAQMCQPHMEDRFVKVAKRSTLKGDEFVFAEDNTMTVLQHSQFPRVRQHSRSVISQAKVFIVETMFETQYDGQFLRKDIFDIISNMGFGYG